MYSSLPYINFTHNWNNCKLNLRSYTTIRLLQPYKYIIAQDYNILLKREFQHVGRIIEIKPFWLVELNEFIARLDTGYSKEDCTQIIKRMYGKVDFTKTRLSLILIRNVSLD